MNEAVSYAALRIIQNLIPDQATQTKETLKIFRSMGYDPNFYAQDSSPAGIGNKIAAEIIAARADDGFNQYGTYPTTMIGTANYSGELIFFLMNPEKNFFKIDWTNYYPVNPAQTIPATTTCRFETKKNSEKKSRNFIHINHFLFFSDLRSRDHWQPLLVPTPDGKTKVQIFSKKMKKSRDHISENIYLLTSIL